MKRALITLLLLVPANALADDGHDDAHDGHDAVAPPPPDAAPASATELPPTPAAIAIPAPSEAAPSKAPAAPSAPGPLDPTDAVDAALARDLGDDDLARFHRLPDTSWRKPVAPRISPKSSGFDVGHGLLELRFGPYAPRVDDEFGGRATPYADYFGASPEFYFGLEGDWLPVRLPYVGSVGLAFGWGVVKASGKAKTASGEDAGSETALKINPMYTAAVFRADGLLHHLNIPIVPYVKAGLGFGMWQATGPAGTSRADGVSGEGTSVGMHLALGGSIALNAFDRRTAMAMRAETGITYAYLWGEWMLADLDGFGKPNAMHVGTSTGIGGLAVEY